MYIVEHIFDVANISMELTAVVFPSFEVKRYFISDGLVSIDLIQIVVLFVL